MRQYNANCSNRNKEVYILLGQYPVHDKAGEASPKQQQGRTLVMVMPVAMPQGYNAQNKGDDDHRILDHLVFQYLDPQERKAADEKG